MDDRAADRAEEERQDEQLADRERERRFDHTPAGDVRLIEGLLPGEELALGVARSQLRRGESVTPNVATVLVVALERLTT